MAFAERLGNGGPMSIGLKTASTGGGALIAANPQIVTVDHQLAYGPQSLDTGFRLGAKRISGQSFGEQQIGKIGGTKRIASSASRGSRNMGVQCLAPVLPNRHQ